MKKLPNASFLTAKHQLACSLIFKACSLAVGLKALRYAKQGWLKFES